MTAYGHWCKGLHSPVNQWLTSKTRKHSKSKARSTTTRISETINQDEGHDVLPTFDDDQAHLFPITSDQLSAFEQLHESGVGFRQLTPWRGVTAENIFFCVLTFSSFLLVIVHVSPGEGSPRSFHNYVPQCPAVSRAAPADTFALGITLTTLKNGCLQHGVICPEIFSLLWYLVVLKVAEYMNRTKLDDCEMRSFSGLHDREGPGTDCKGADSEQMTSNTISKDHKV